MVNRKELTMKFRTLALASLLALTTTLASAQTKPTGTITGDPAASSGNSKSSIGDTTGMAPSKSGSGTSTSGGSDANGDQGRDKMPDSSIGVRPLDKQNKPKT